MKVDDAFGGVVPALSSEDILKATPNIFDLAAIECLEFGRYPGPHITPAIMLQLAQIIQEQLERPDIDGIVVTHGTDTLEETAYFLDCTVTSPKPVVVIGSMRNSSEPDWDGPRNLRDGITIAASPKARDLGVLVSLAETLHAASEVSKIDTTNIHTFESLNFGPVGRILNGKLFIHRQPVHRDYFKVEHLPRFVPLLKCYASDEALLLRTAIDSNAEGIVLEAMGVGNVPPPVYSEIVRARQADIPVVLVSRCPIGRVEHIYAYEGAGKQLYEAGVIFADYCNGQKARIKLMAALGAGCNSERVRQSFEWTS